MGSTMSFETLYSRVLKRKDHQYYLLKKEVYTEEIEPQRVLKDEIGNIIPKDKVGNIKEKWQEVQELKGVVQHRQTEKITELSFIAKELATKLAIRF